MGDTDPTSSIAAQSALHDKNLNVLDAGAHIARASAKNETASETTWMSRLMKRLGFASKKVDVVAPEAIKVPVETVPGMINLRRMRVDDVAVPRADLISVSFDISQKGLVDVFRKSGNTRLPVYKETIDEPVGFVHLKDFALHYGFNAVNDELNMKALLRPLLYVPPSMPIGVLLQKMQSERMHMALVIDEYGGVDGLVTLEDLVEQVIGEIEDEHDAEEDAFWVKSAPGIYVAKAKAPLEELEGEIGMRLSDVETGEEIDTLGGLVFLLTGRVPARGEVIPHKSGAEFEIIDADPRTIKRIRLRMPAAAKARKSSRDKKTS